MCIFCKIINKEIPAYIVYEDDFVIAILDIYPMAKGHTLVIPKKHVTRLKELSEEEAKKLFAGLKKVIEKIEKISPDYNIIINQGPKAGQEIDHLHIHIIPRTGEEKIFYNIRHKLTEEEAKEVLEKLNG
ncbi:NEQ519 [Nanoarchaeum equitans Kin4-M]|uniref:NEQ519 n=1 Tax=Nanoarchaeum equitans (strain Kin4-M) TaxID=228908 RepID=Q74MW7_NANEQ|nr:NEQ519 [Nanoarchaeum equitans Kin4-M]